MRHVPYLFGCALLLSGCTDADWNHLLGYADLAQGDNMGAQPSQSAPAPQTTTPTAPPPAPLTSQAPDTSFCRDVATQDATSNDFDAPTQQRVFSQSYAQCLAIYAR